jgi:SpoVK/Ycf46/Vps4 family AAA+-type ATPase
VKENGQLVVVEGNRRLAALKALREPGLLDGSFERQMERLARQIEDVNEIATVPVTLAPSRRATDRQIAGRHVGTPVLPWQAENRASFILDKLAEGYTNDQLRDQLGFSLADIQSARQTRAIAEIARSIDLPEIKAKVEAPRAKFFLRWSASSIPQWAERFEGGTDPSTGYVANVWKNCAWQRNS